MSPIFYVVALVSFLFYAVLFVGGVLFIRHMWKELQQEGEGSIHQRTLDEVQQLSFRLAAASERLQERMDRLERKLDALPPGEEDRHGPPEDPSPPPPSTTTRS